MLSDFFISSVISFRFHKSRPTRLGIYFGMSREEKKPFNEWSSLELDLMEWEKEFTGFIKRSRKLGETLTAFRKTRMILTGRGGRLG